MLYHNTTYRFIKTYFSGVSEGRILLMPEISLPSLLVLSVPEEFMLALFAWVILSKRDTVGIINVVTAGLVAAVSFESVHILFYPDLALIAVIQVVAFVLILYFIYKTSYIEAIVAGLLTFIAVLVVQATVVSVGLAITGYGSQNYETSLLAKFITLLPELAVMGIGSFICYKKKIKVFDFKMKKKDECYSSKIRYLILQLTFTLLIIAINYKIFFVRVGILDSTDKMMVAINFTVILLFTVLVIKSAFKMGDSIQKDGDMKRTLDGKEIVQNIDCLCKLLESKEYNEVKDILESLKHEVDSGMINNDGNNRGATIGNSIK